jgi:hypothetical protein
MDGAVRKLVAVLWLYQDYLERISNDDGTRKDVSSK